MEINIMVTVLNYVEMRPCCKSMFILLLDQFQSAKNVMHKMDISL